MENLRGVSHEVAAAKPFANTHSIWELVNHLAAWQKFAVDVINGATYETLKGDADWPPVVNKHEGEWSAAMWSLESSFNDLVAKLDDFSDEKLKENVPGSDYSWRVLLRGIAEHALYHAGQIGLLKKAVA
jgi:uncharacterized damage-inducible protein DinB